MVVANRALMRKRPVSDDHRRRELLSTADATVLLVDQQLERLEALLTEVRNVEHFVERRGTDHGRRPDRRAS